MSVDQAVIQMMAARMRAEADCEAAARAERRRRLGVRDDWGGAVSLIGARATRAVQPLDSGPPRRPARSSFVFEEPPRGKAARPMAVVGGGRRVSVGGGAQNRAEKIAAGYQPAVLKVISYGHGVQRATAMGQYVQRDQVALETHTGKLLANQEEVAAEMKEWVRGFEKRRDSDDVAAFRLSVAGDRDEDRLVAAVEAGFSGHRFAYRIERHEDGSLEAQVVATMAGHTYVHGENGAEKVRERFHLSEARGDARGKGEQQFSRPTQLAVSRRIVDALGVSAEAVNLVPDGPASHGKAGVVYQLSRLASRGDVVGQDKGAISTEPQVRATAQAWNRSLNSFSPRDVMHMILSAKAGEDKEALVATARSFLHAQFPEHKFAFALHDDKESEGHMHVHVIVAVRGEDGQKMDPGPADLRAWREAYAEHAQAHGMKIVATSAAYRASSQSYGPKDKSIVDVADRPRDGREARDRAYAQMNPHVVDNARQRIQRAQTNPIRIPRSSWELQAVNDGLADFRAAASAQPGNPIAAEHANRLTQAQASGSVLVALQDYRQGNAMADATAAEMRENLRDLNSAVAVAADVMDGAEKTEFLRRTAQTMEMLAIRTDVKAKQESGVNEFTEDEIRQIAGPHADAIIAHARQIQAADELEAQRLEQISDRSIELQYEHERSGKTDPASLQEVAEDRATTRHAETIASRERIEAQAAAEAARALAENPTQKLNPNLVQSDRLEELQREQQRLYNKQGVDITGGDEEEPDSQKPTGQRM